MANACWQSKPGVSALYAEGVPKILPEAAASGRAIVATGVPGCRGGVDYGVNGLHVPSRNPEALAQAIAELVSDPARRQQMGCRGREICEIRFSGRLVIDSILRDRQQVVEYPEGPANGLPSGRMLPHYFPTLPERGSNSFSGCRRKQTPSRDHGDNRPA
jgi:Glycosyl transferases group 1